MVFGRSILVGSKRPCLFKMFPQRASATCNSQGGHVDCIMQMSHTRALSSDDAVTMRLPSGLNWAEKSFPRCFIGSVKGYRCARPKLSRRRRPKRLRHTGHPG